MAWDDWLILAVLAGLVSLSQFQSIQAFRTRRFLPAVGYAAISPLWAVASAGVYSEAMGVNLSMAIAGALWVVGLLPASIAAATLGRPIREPDALLLDDDEAVIVVLPDTHVDANMDMGDLETALCEVVEPLGLGYCDGDEVWPDGARLFFFGPDAELMFEAMEPVLRTHVMTKGARVELYSCWPEGLSRTVELAVAV